MTLDELKTEISERIESEQDKLNRLNESRKDRNYYIYQLLKKTLKEYGYRKYDIKNRASAPKEYTIQGREDGSKSIFELREFIEENIPKDVSVLVYIDKRKKVLEVMYYDKDKGSEQGE